MLDYFQVFVIIVVLLRQECRLSYFINMYIFMFLKGLLSSVKKEEILRFKAYLGEYGMALGRQQSAKV